MKYEIWDDVDHFLYYDYWHREGHASSLLIRKTNILDLFEVAKNKKIELFLGDLTVLNIFQSRKFEYDLKDKAEYIFAFIKNKEELLKSLENINFKIVSTSRNKFYILRENRLIVINFVRDRKIFKKTFKIELFQNTFNCFTSTKLKIVFFYKPVYFFSTIYRKVFSIKVKYLNKLNQQKLIKNLGVEKLDKDKIYKIDINTFLNLQIENKYSPSWLIRRQHLNTVTNRKRNIKISKIVKYFQKTNILETTFENINESIIDSPIIGSVSHSKKFWFSGDNYFFYSIYYKFKKNVVPYKNVNDYILKQNDPKIYTREYFESLNSMNQSEIEIFLQTNPIEITNNSISSGKHRVFAMIGRLIKEEEYIPFYSKII